MASLKRPNKCGECNNADLQKKKKPERWICLNCGNVAASRPMRSQTGVCRVCERKKTDELKFKSKQNICVECASEEHKVWREENDEHCREYRKDYFSKLDKKERWQRVRRTIESTPERFLADQMYHIKSRSEKPEHPHNASDPAKREHDLDREFLAGLWESQNGLCAVSQFPMVHKFKCFNSASIDRIDSSKGHTKENIQIVCLAFNRAKHEGDNEEFKEFLDSYFHQRLLAEGYSIKAKVTEGKLPDPDWSDWTE